MERFIYINTAVGSIGFGGERDSLEEYTLTDYYEGMYESFFENDEFDVVIEKALHTCPIQRNGYRDEKDYREGIFNWTNEFFKSELSPITIDCVVDGEHTQLSMGYDLRTVFLNFISDYTADSFYHKRKYGEI